MDFHEGVWFDESLEDIVDYLTFAGFDLNRDQVARLARRRLIEPPRPGLDGDRGASFWFAEGTAERLLRIAQLREATKQLDELAWRLWWEGFYVEPSLVRGYLTRKARRWDEQLAERGEEPAPEEAEASSPTKSVARGKGFRAREERDVLEEVFFQHLKTGPASSAARRQLERGAALYEEFAELFVHLLDRVGEFEHISADLFETSRDGRIHDSLEPSGDAKARVSGRVLELSLEKIVDSLGDEEISQVRLVTRAVLGVVGDVGQIISDVFEGSARGREQVGKTLTALSASPNEQALALLLTTALRRSGRLPASSEVIDPTKAHRPVISYRDFRRLQYLSGSIPELGALLELERVRPAFRSAAVAEAWRQDFEALRFERALEFEMAMDMAPELFDDGPPEVEEDAEDDEWVIAKKKILNEGRRTSRRR